MNNTTTIFTAFWGVFLLASVFALSLIPTLKYALIDTYKDNKMRFSGALLSFCLGAVSIYFHNIWELNMAGLITAFGWIALVKGIVIVAFPSVIKISENIVKSRWFGFYLLLLFCLGWYMLLWSISLPINV